MVSHIKFTKNGLIYLLGICAPVEHYLGRTLNDNFRRFPTLQRLIISTVQRIHAACKNNFISLSVPGVYFLILTPVPAINIYGSAIHAH